MSWLNILGIAVGLAMDALAVSIAAGLVIDPLTRRHVFRLAFHFGLFQFMMPVIGWLAGTTLAGRIHPYDHWVAFGLLVLIGGKMLWESRRKGGAPSAVRDPTRGWALVALSVATSIDALGAGLSMAFLEVSIWLPSVVIGLVAAGFTWVGIRFGRRLGGRCRRWAEVLGGLVLLAIGVRILVTHLLA